eukprot:751899-Hanusia_phi.AAC.4
MTTTLILPPPLSRCMILNKKQAPLPPPPPPLPLPLLFQLCSLEPVLKDLRAFGARNEEFSSRWQTNAKYGAGEPEQAEPKAILAQSRGRKQSDWGGRWTGGRRPCLSCEERGGDEVRVASMAAALSSARHALPRKGLQGERLNLYKISSSYPYYTLKNKGWGTENKSRLGASAMRLRWVNLLLFLLLFRSSSLLLLFPLPPSPSLRLISTPSCLPSFHLPITLRGENRGGSGAKTCWGRTWMMPRGRREEERAAAVHDHERIVVCGGGINGASLAYILAKQGKRPLLFDREWDQRGKHTFDHLDCVMGLIPSDWYKDRYLENASTRTFELHHAWQGELAALGLGYGGMQNATILEPITQTVPKMLFDKERALLLKLSNGSTAEASKFFPSTEEICQRFPWLSPEFVYGAYYVSEQDLAKRVRCRGREGEEGEMKERRKERKGEGYEDEYVSGVSSGGEKQLAACGDQAWGGGSD